MTAAILRQTAAAAANVKSEIHMARFPRSVSVRLMVLDCGVNAGRRLPVPGTFNYFVWYINTTFDQRAHLPATIGTTMA
jgi:hypothetical protein